MLIGENDVVLTPKTSQEFSDWLAKNHSGTSSVWIRIYKKDTGKQTVTYNQVLDEALCYGWIDGIAKKYDTDSYVQRFTPRRPKGNWSKRNIARVKDLLKEGRMKPSGIEKARQAGILL